MTIHKPPGCEKKKWAQIYPITLAYIAVMVTLIVILLIKGVS